MASKGENMLTVSLEDMKFYAGHGVYEEEDVIGNTFLLNVFVTIDAPEKIDHLAQTIDYERLYDIVCSVMKTQAELLETIASVLVADIKKTFPQARIIEIKINKLYPPMGGEIGQSGIKLVKHFD